MSRETSEWLNQNVLVGFTAKRGTAWHYRASDQGDESNHYEGAIPIEDVRRRLFFWDALSAELTATVGDLVVPVTDRQAIVRSDTGLVMGVFKSGYVIHQFNEWLLDTVGTILDDTLSIGSAGLLTGGSRAWVSVEVPDSVVTPEGVEFRPNLIATTSHDGTLATTFKRIVTNVVCDNTHDLAMSETGQAYKVKHSKYSKAKIADARDALAIIHNVGDEFEAQVKALCETEVTDKQWSAFVTQHFPLPTDEKNKRGMTVAEKGRETLTGLWNADPRVSPWKGTAWGVVQATNTYDHHFRQIRKAGDDANARRAEVNMTNALDGKTAASDSATLATLYKVLATV